MSGAGNIGVQATVARLVREMGEPECRRRNALSQTAPGFRLKAGDVVQVVETFREGFLVEFGPKAADRCDWMGVLYPSEIEMIDRDAGAGGPAGGAVRHAPER